MSETRWKPEPELLTALDESILGTLESQNDAGRFGDEPWICQDQNVLLALAAAWSLPESEWHRDERVLAAIVKGGDALIDDMDDEGRWTFRKKDGSTWGMIRMPWTYSRWIRAYQLTRDAFSDAARSRWDDALQLGYANIARSDVGSPHNIPAHHAMGLYCAGIVFGREEWRGAARDLLHRVVETQSPHGWWSEHSGPVVAYGMVYIEALGVYYSLSADYGERDTVLDALERAARFHANWTYPDGSAVEVIDERNPYHAGVRLPNPGFAHTPVGRSYVANQHAQHVRAGGSFGDDYAANMLLYAVEGSTDGSAASSGTTAAMGTDALVMRRGPWFVATSSYVSKVPQNRWIQDRQCVVSVFHDGVGLILGGGNTKLQPLWSTFTVGDPTLLAHAPGDEDPDFLPPDGLIHTPTRATTSEDGGAVAVELEYADTHCSVRVELEDERAAFVTFAVTEGGRDPVQVNLPLLVDVGEQVTASGARTAVLGDEAFEWTLLDDSPWIAYGGVRIVVPSGATARWPVLPHNPYRKDGHAEITEGRFVVSIPLTRAAPRVRVAITVEESQR